MPALCVSVHHFDLLAVRISQYDGANFHEIWRKACLGPGNIPLDLGLVHPK